MPLILTAALANSLVVPIFTPQAGPLTTQSVLLAPQPLSIGTAQAPRASLPGVFPGTSLLGQTIPIGNPKASRTNPAAFGNAEGNWWTSSASFDTDCEGNKVSPGSKLSQECITQKKVDAIKERQSINAENGKFKVERIEAIEARKAEVAAQKAARNKEIKAAQAKYALK